MPQSLVSQLEERLLRLNIVHLADLREQVQLTYWSEIHFVTQALIDFLPFGYSLGPTKFYEYVDYQLPVLINRCRQTRAYWEIHPSYTHDQTPVSDITLSYDETFFWHYYVPAKTPEITQAILQGNRIRFLSRFYLSETEIRLEFQEIRIQITDQGTRLIGALGKEYVHKWEETGWSATNINLEQTLINPVEFFLPILLPNAQGREPEYQRRLGIILTQPDHLGIDDSYWNSVDSTEIASDLPSSTRANTPDLIPIPFPPPADHCGCGIDICYCDNYRPETPPTPPYIELWSPREYPAPVPGLHYDRIG